MTNMNNLQESLRTSNEQFMSMTREERQFEDSEHTYMSIQVLNITLQVMSKDDPQRVFIVRNMVRMMLPVREEGEEDNNTRSESSGSLISQNRSENALLKQNMSTIAGREDVTKVGSAKNGEIGSQVKEEVKEEAEVERTKKPCSQFGRNKERECRAGARIGMEKYVSMDRVEETNDVEDVIFVNEDEGDEIQAVSMRKKSWGSREDGVVHGCRKQEKVVVIEDERNGMRKWGQPMDVGKITTGLTWMR